MPEALSNSFQNGVIFEGDSAQKVLSSVWKTIENHGHEYLSQRGPVRSIKGATLIINDPMNDQGLYPYWDKTEDDWYQDNFVRKETNFPPEELFLTGDVYPYKYVWRSRYYDGGTGYVMAVCRSLNNTGYHTLEGIRRETLIEMIKTTYKSIHPEVLLSVLGWKTRELLNGYLANPKHLQLELLSNRRDTLQSVINEVAHDPSTRRAIMPSFIYEHIDHSGAAGGVPVYQNYQLTVDFDTQGNPKGLTSYHLHRALDAKGGNQLDFNHDREWGMIASKQLGIPLGRIVVYCNDIYAYQSSANRNLSQKTDIRSWLHAVTDAYDPRTEDIEKRLASPLYQKKIEYTIQQLQR